MSWTGFVPPAIVTAALLLPFVDKAYHVDDTLFLRVAEQIRREPFHPYDFDYDWAYRPASMWRIAQNPPLNGYLLAGIGALAGLSEPAVHLFYLALAVGCALTMHWLARRFCAHPTLATMVTVISPAFLVSAGNVMADIPLLLFWLLAVAATVHAVERSRPSALWWAGLSGTLAAMTKYFGIAVVPLALAYWLLKRQRPSVHLIGLIVPVVVLVAWGFHAEQRCGFFHPLQAADYAISGRTAAEVLANLAGTLTFLGGVMLWPVILLPAVSYLPTGLRGCVVAIALVGALAGALQGGWGVKAAYGLMLLTGGTALVQGAAGWRARPDAESWLLLLWCLGTLVFSVFLNWTVNARVLLPMIFPAGLLVIRWLEGLEQPHLWMRLQRGAFPVAVLSLAVAAGDYELARAGKAFAEQVARPLLAEGGRVHFAGHWGFQYYMEKEGAQPLNYPGSDLEPGARIVYPQNNSNVLALDRPSEPVLSREFPNRFWLHTIRADAGSSFYMGNWGGLPYYLAPRLPADVFVVERLVGDGWTRRSVR